MIWLMRPQKQQNMWGWQKGGKWQVRGQEKSKEKKKERQGTRGLEGAGGERHRNGRKQNKGVQGFLLLLIFIRALPLGVPCAQKEN